MTDGWRFTEHASTMSDQHESFYIWLKALWRSIVPCAESNGPCELLERCAAGLFRSLTHSILRLRVDRRAQGFAAGVPWYVPTLPDDSRVMNRCLREFCGRIPFVATVLFWPPKLSYPDSRMRRWVSEVQYGSHSWQHVTSAIGGRWLRKGIAPAIPSPMCRNLC